MQEGRDLHLPLSQQAGCDSQREDSTLNINSPVLDSAAWSYPAFGTCNVIIMLGEACVTRHPELALNARIHTQPTDRDRVHAVVFCHQNTKTQAGNCLGCRVHTGVCLVHDLRHAYKIRCVTARLPAQEQTQCGFDDLKASLRNTEPAR